MILDRLDMGRPEFETLSGWTLSPEGACKDGLCVPFEPGGLDCIRKGERLDVADFARQLGMPLAHDERHGIWSLGPRAGGHALQDARMPRLVLPDVEGRPFDLASLRGLKVLLVAWSTW